MTDISREQHVLFEVAKRLNGAGFLITADPTEAIKEGVQVWPT